MPLGDNWGAVLAEHWSDGDVETQASSAPRGFPPIVPLFEEQPDFEWTQRGAKTPRERRLDYERSRTTFTSLRDHRQPGMGKRDISQDIYLRRQDEEYRKACRHGFIYLLKYSLK